MAIVYIQNTNYKVYQINKILIVQVFVFYKTYLTNLLEIDFKSAVLIFYSQTIQ